MGRTNGSRGAWVFRMFLITFLAAVIALTGQSQALAAEAEPEPAPEASVGAPEASDVDCSDNFDFMEMIEGESDPVADFGDLIDCGAKNLEALVAAGQLASVNIEPLGRAGSTGDVLISFTTANPVLENGQVVVTLPEGFGVFGVRDDEIEVTRVKFEDGSMASQDAVVVDVNARKVTAVFSTPIKVGDDVVLTLIGIKHPEVSGSPGRGGSVLTQNDAADPIDSCIDGPDCTIVYTDVKPGALTDLVFDLGDEELNRVDDDNQLLATAAGSTGEVFVNFRTTNPVPKGGQVVVTFPVGFEVGSGIKVLSYKIQADAKSGEFGSITGSAHVGSRSVTITVTVAEGIGADELVTLKLSEIKNPEVTSGITGEPKGGGIVTYSDIIDADENPVVIDVACDEELDESHEPWLRGIECTAGEVYVDTITPGQLGISDNAIELGDDKAGAIGTVTVTFTLDNPLPANGAIAVTFPKGFVLNASASEGNPTQAIFIDPEGQRTLETVPVRAITHGEKTIAVFSRSGPDGLDEDSVVKVELTYIRNPQVSGQTQNFEIRTSVGD